MGISAIRQLLRSLCHNSQWEYAVFWKLKHQSRLLLTWEDGYCDYPIPKESMEGTSDNVCLSETTRFTSFDCESGTLDGGSMVYPIRLAVASMSCIVYSLGEGVVGRAASTGNHCWVFADEFNSELLLEYPEEWKLQVEVGIKTVLLVPVIPHGVVQLGSLKTVSEDPALVVQIKNMFNTLQHVPGTSMPFITSRDLPVLSPSSVSSLPPENSADPSSNTSNMLSTIQSELLAKTDPVALDGIQMTLNKLSTINADIISWFTGQDDFQLLENNAGSMGDAVFSDLSESPIALSLTQGHISNTSYLKITGNNTPDFSCLEEDIKMFGFNLTQLGFSADSNMSRNFFSSNDMMDQPSGVDTGKEMDCKSMSGFLSFPPESELHKALGPAFQESCNEYLWYPTFSGENICSSSSLICHTDLTGGIKPPVGESKEWILEEGDAENLLDSMVANVYGASCDTASNRSNSVRSPTTSSGQFAATFQTQSYSRSSGLVGDESGQCRHLGPAFVSECGKGLPGYPSRSSLKHMTSKLTVEEQQKKGPGFLQSRKGAKLPHTGKRKARLGNVQRPRPKDRQMIQDRVKELRELVPNSAKCSIDTLLNQTIKHMLFLRSVSDQAEKLKQCMHPKAVGRKNWKSSEIQGHQHGASWAFEFGNQFGVCPILVKDLDHPGNMLIEMLCEEHGLFLEIAQAIRQLELTILKGALENRSNKMWAHFIVEASSGFQRMDIFWPLMRLLQKNNHIPSLF